MEKDQTKQFSEPSSSSSLQIVLFAVTAAITAALFGIGTYLFFLKRTANSPQGFLDRCRHAIDDIEHGIDNAGYA